MRFRIRLILPLLTLLFASVASGEVFRVGSDVHCTHSTLASALAAAAANGPGQDEIRLTVDSRPTNATFSITQSDVLISGGWFSCGVVSPAPAERSLIVGNGHDSVFYIGNGRTVELRQLAITNGGRHGVVNNDFAIGGGVWLNGGVAILRGVRVMHNRARFGGGLAANGNSVMVIYGGTAGSEIHYNEAMLGGGIYVGERAALRIENDNVAVTHNSANGSATAHENAGGGIYAVGTASNTSNVEVNWLSGEPGVLMPTPRGFLLSDNVTTGNGGGIALHGTASFIAVEATIRDNAATGSGGGIYLYGNAVHSGASAQMTRFLDHLPAWLKNCKGRYGCNQITGNVASRGGAVTVMHGNLRLGQVLLADNHSTAGGGAAIHTGSIGTVSGIMNRIWLDSAVIADNHCSGPAAHSPCATLSMGAGPNQAHIQHVTMADNTLAATPAAGGPWEIYNGPTTSPLVLRSSIIEPKSGVQVLFASNPIDADCVKAPAFSGNGTRALPLPAPYAFVSRASYDYRPAVGNSAIDACDTSQLLDSGLGGADLVRHGSVDDPGVPNRLGPTSLADIGAFEVTVMLRDGFE